MKHFAILVSLVTMLCYGCEHESDSVPVSRTLPFVKAECTNLSLFLLDSMHSFYGFPVRTVFQSQDTIDLNKNILMRGISISVLGEDKFDSIEEANQNTFWYQRRVQDTNEFHYLDSFSLQIDTTNQVCTQFYVRSCHNEEATRAEVTRAYPVFIKNLSGDTVRISEYSGVQLEILASKNKWEVILSDNVMCETGAISYWIAPSETVIVLVPVTEGKYSRTMRVKFGDKYSSPFQARCNFN